MKITDLPEVSGVGEPGIYRYLVALIIGDKNEQRIVLRAGMYDSSKQHVAYGELEACISEECGMEISYEILGGGILQVDVTYIDVFGKPRKPYNTEPNRAETVALLCRAFPVREIRNRT